MAWRGGVKEVFSVIGDKIRIEIGHDSSEQEQRHELKRVWAQVVLEHPWNNWHPSCLFIRPHGDRSRQAVFLNEAERQAW